MQKRTAPDRFLVRNNKTETKFITLLKTVYASGINSIFTGNASEFTSRLFTILLLWIGAGFVLDSTITPGELLSFYALIGYFTGPITNLVGTNKTVQNAMIAADRLFEIMDLERESNENKIELTAEMTGDITFRNVHFRYGARASVLHDVNLCFQKGKVTALVGESGSGKSTLISILQNLYPLQSGNITIGNYDLKYIDNESLRKIVSVVPQKTDLFAGNVIENIAIGDHQPDMKKIVTICGGLGILDFIEGLPNGFLTDLGENGSSLSGGQKQRIAIARALYRSPEVLILDEATSSLDSASEQYTQRMLKALRQNGKTIILIAHRLSTVYEADKIIVLEKGTAIEEGTHSELMQNKSRYYNLWKNQFPMLEETNHSLITSQP